MTLLEMMVGSTQLKNVAKLTVMPLECSSRSMLSQYAPSLASCMTIVTEVHHKEEAPEKYSIR